MIDLKIQFDLIIFSFVYGMLFRFFLLKLDKYIHHKNIFFSIINSFSYILTASLLYFYNIEKIASGILHPYSILMVILGYYLFIPIENILKK